MSGIAELLLNLGYRVSGSDLKESDITRRLASLGGSVVVGHSAENVAADVDVVVTSSAVRKHNPEVVAAKDRGIPVIPRAEMLAELMRLKEGVAIAGSHGKTTTTSLIATVLAHAKLDPTAVVGGKLNALGSNAKLGKGQLMVVEADESDGSFLRLSPAIAVITNVDPEHLDYYGTVEALQQAFVDFADRVPFYGLAVLCVDHPVVQHLIPRIGKRHTTYGLSPQAEWRADDIRHAAFQPHRYTRTRDLMGEFATAFNDADSLLLTEVYAASEDPIPGVTGARLHEAVKACGHRDAAFAERAELARRLREKVRPGDLVITLGAGDITHVGEELLGLLG